MEKTYEYGVIVGTKREREYWKNKIEKEIEELKNMNVDGEVFKTSVNFATKVLQELFEE